MGELTPIQLGVVSILLQKRLMAPLLHNVSVPHHQDQIRLPDGA